jgi:prepilin-type N-terminal cleavage/methylation domain-containing protein
MNPRAAHPACSYLRKPLLATRCRPSSSSHRQNRGFSLTELLVAIAIIAVLMSLSAVAVNAARNSQKVNQTRLTISKLNRIISEQLRRYDSRYIAESLLPDATSVPNRSAARAWYIRRNLVTGDMPDRWSDVAVIATGTSTFTTPSQNAYRKVWLSLTDVQQGYPPSSPNQDPKINVRIAHESAECLFLVIMHGGFADCLDCGPLRSSEVGDKDQDGMPEFWDAWGNPIEFLLWAPGLELPVGTNFFSAGAAFPTTGVVRPMLGLRPVIYSTGPDGQAGYLRGDLNLDLGSSPLGRDCGNPSATSVADRGGRDSNQSVDYRRDNVTNFDSEVK